MENAVVLCARWKYPHSQIESCDASFREVFGPALIGIPCVGRFQRRLLASINGDAPSGSLRLAHSVIREQEVIILEAALPFVLSVCPFLFAG
jgi:hypothetical protein